LLGLLDSFFDILGVVEFWQEVRAKVLEVFAEGEKMVFIFINIDVGCVVFGGFLSWCGDVHCFSFGWFVGFAVAAVCGRAKSLELCGDEG
jgi:hypothetical protein